jgi:hypothetical protein
VVRGSIVKCRICPLTVRSNEATARIDVLTGPFRCVRAAAMTGERGGHRGRTEKGASADAAPIEAARAIAKRVCCHIAPLFSIAPFILNGFGTADAVPTSAVDGAMPGK